jgi:hypothetical protein
MAVSVNNVSDLKHWADSKSCEGWKADRSCEHAGCAQAQRAVDILSALFQTGPGIWTIDESDIVFTA